MFYLLWSIIFMNIGNNTECLRVKVNDHNCLLFTNVVGFDRSGKVNAVYELPDGTVFYREEIGKVILHTFNSGDDLKQKIHEIAQQHFDELETTFQQIRELEVSLQDAVLSGIFSERRIAFIQEKRIQAIKKRNQTVKKFIEVTEKRMMHDHYLRLNVDPEFQDGGPSAWGPVVLEDGNEAICDKEWPLEAAFARLLMTNRYKNIPYPDLKSLIEVFCEARNLRMSVIDMVDYYELYFEGKLIYKKSGNKVDIYNSLLFAELCTPVKDVLLSKFIDQQFIENAIEKGHVPKNCLKKLKEYKGYSIKHAILIESTVYGNHKRVQQINREEIDALDGTDKFLFHIIECLCTPDRELSQETIKNFKYTDGIETWDKLEHRYKYLLCNDGLSTKERQQYTNKYVGDESVFGNEFEWQRYRLVRNFSTPPVLKKIKTIFKYLMGQASQSSLNFQTEGLPDLLKFAKMFDLALSLSNCKRATKKTFQVGSYNLRKAILEKMTHFCSFDVFSRTLFYQRLKDAKYIANPKNWIDARVGLQAKLFANTFILAKSLSERMPTPRLIAGRGNAASGKSTAMNLQSESVSELLKFAKIFNFALSLSNRMRSTKETLLENMSHFSSFDPFSRTFFYQRLNQADYIANAPVGLDAKVYDNAFILAKSLSDGNAAGSTASGKETGISNPDTIKFGLRKKTNIKNHQIHIEGSNVFKLFFDEMAYNTKYHYILDLRLITLETLKKYLIEPARIRNCTIFLSDFDVPLFTTLNRMLKRDPKGEDPVLSLDPMLSGFRDVRIFRKEVVDFVIKENLIEEYNLYYMNNIIAKKQNDQMVIFDALAYKECFNAPSIEELEKCTHRTIDDDYIDEACLRGDLKLTEKGSLERWKGWTIRDALYAHANGISPQERVHRKLR